MVARRLVPALLMALLAACGDAPKVSPPLLQLSASALAFAGVAQGANPAAQQVTVSNGGGGTLGTPTVDVAYGAGAGWLVATVAGAAAPYTLTVQPSLAGLAAGTYLATIRVASVSSAGPAQTVGVTLVVSAAPVPSGMALSPAALEFRAATAGTDPAAQAVAVAATGTTPLAVPVATVTYGATAQGWLTATVSGGAAPFSVNVQVATAGLPLGAHTATVELASAGATNTPQAFPVTLFVGRAVDVTRTLTAWAEDGATATAPDAAVTGVTLLQDDGAGGLARTPAVRALAAGTWTAVAAPGAYLAELAFADGHLAYLQASADRLDAGEDRGGRADRVAATLPTEVTLLLSGLFEWDLSIPGSDYDRLRLVSWGAQAGYEWDPPLDAGSTDGSTVVDWQAVGGGLLAAGDVLRVLQFRLSIDGAIAYQEVVSAADSTGQALADGQAASITLAASTTPDTATASLVWQRDAMEAASAPFAAAGAGFAHRAGLYAIPAPLTSPSPLAGTPVALLEVVDAALSGDIAASPLTFGRFLPAGWSEYVDAAFETPAPRRAAPAASPALLPQRVLHRTAAPSGSPTAINAAPLVGVVQAPLLDGADALAPQAASSTTPTLSWSAPAVGAPTSYQVAVHALTAPSGATVSRLVASFTLPDGTLSLRLPAGVLAAGGTYAALITARSSPGDASGASPYRVGVPYGDASLWTEVFTVP